MRVLSPLALKSCGGSHILQAREGFNLLEFVCFLKLKRACRAFSFKCSSEILKLPVEEMWVPKYMYIHGQYQWFLYLYGILDWSFSSLGFERS